MNLTRRQFSSELAAGFFSLGLGPGTLAQSLEKASAASPSPMPHYLFKDPTFEVIFLTALGRSYYSAGNIGKVLYLTRQVEDGNFESAYLAFKGAGDEARQMAEESASQGHKVSALQAYMWAQNFYDSATYFVDGSKDPARFLPTWELLYECWMKTVPAPRADYRADKDSLRKYRASWLLFPRTGAEKKRPLLILVNGSDGSLLDMCCGEVRALCSAATIA